MMEILFAIALLSLDVELLRGIKYLRFITLGILIPLTVTPNMYFLWVKLGTGNANFLFFQGLCFWVFLTMFLIEYIHSYLKRLDAQSSISDSDQGMEKKVGTSSAVTEVANEQTDGKLD
jgi:membrane protein implicated in regulation of membrane protease activity